ncbi:hypothetical protein DICVIV_01878 [Dictyocaulus viviparus]|uniref:Uncharacterized protein n=1 Tax=Dictyocaulus viviparus TaxID=29172 RepID=A0A0D8Y6S5_DICVI|nr:hypothetical protein DICVIV_01878 [Dictyocaulus viviparus]
MPSKRNTLSGYHYVNSGPCSLINIPILKLFDILAEMIKATSLCPMLNEHRTAVVCEGKIYDEKQLIYNLTQ